MLDPLVTIKHPLTETELVLFEDLEGIHDRYLVEITTKQGNVLSHWLSAAEAQLLADKLPASLTES